MSDLSCVSAPATLRHLIRVLTLAAAVLLVGSSSPAFGATSPTSLATITRISGSDRYVVAARTARAGWDPAADKTWPGVTDVLLVCGETGKEYDALAAGGLAGVYEAPMLLTRSNGVPVATKTIISEIAARNPGVRIHLVGGAASVPDARFTELSAIPGVSPENDRVGGADRYALTAEIAKRMVSVVGTDAIPGVLMVCADDPRYLSHALAVSPVAYSRHMPMLGFRLGEGTPDVVGSVLGGELAGKERYNVSTDGLHRIPERPERPLTRSLDRYVAATEIADACIANGWVDAPPEVGLAAKTPDAVTGGALLGKRGGVLLYTDTSDRLRRSTRAWLAESDTRAVWVFGGTASVQPAVVRELNVLLGVAARGERVVAIARGLLGSPYKWGGSGPDAFDCSGLTMYVYSQVGVSLPHSSRAQSVCGAAVDRASLIPGDLVFFGSPIDHVGIYTGGGNMIHAPHTGAVVRVDPAFRSDYVGARRP